MEKRLRNDALIEISEIPFLFRNTMFRRGLIKRKGEKERREFRVSSRLFGSVAKNRGTDFNWNKFGPGRKKARRVSCPPPPAPLPLPPHRIAAPSLANLLGRVTALEWPWTARIKFVFGRAPAKLDRTEINPRLSVRREERVAAAAALN